MNNVSAISGFCEKCNGFRKRYCDGDRNTCMSILFDTIESLQKENEQLRAKLGDWKYEVQCHMDEVTARDKENEQLRAQVARMKEALELCSWYGSEGLCIDEKLARKIMKALRPDSGTDYHNPTKNEMIEINEQTTTKVKYPKILDIYS